MLPLLSQPAAPLPAAAFQPPFTVVSGNPGVNARQLNDNRVPINVISCATSDPYPDLPLATTESDGDADPDEDDARQEPDLPELSEGDTESVRCVNYRAPRVVRSWTHNGEGPEGADYEGRYYCEVLPCKLVDPQAEQICARALGGITDPLCEVCSVSYAGFRVVNIENKDIIAGIDGDGEETEPVSIYEDDGEGADIGGMDWLEVLFSLIGPGPDNGIYGGDPNWHDNWMVNDLYCPDGVPLESCPETSLIVVRLRDASHTFGDCECGLRPEGLQCWGRHTGRCDWNRFDQERNVIRWSDLRTIVDRVDEYLEVEVFAYLDPVNPIWRYRWSPVEFWCYDDKYKNEPALRIVARESTNPQGRPWANCFVKFDWAWIDHATMTAVETPKGGLVGFSQELSPGASTEPEQVVALNNIIPSITYPIKVSGIKQSDKMKDALIEINTGKGSYQFGFTVVWVEIEPKYGNSENLPNDFDKYSIVKQNSLLGDDRLWGPSKIGARDFPILNRIGMPILMKGIIYPNDFYLPAYFGTNQPFAFEYVRYAESKVWNVELGKMGSSTDIIDTIPPWFYDIPQGDLNWCQDMNPQPNGNLYAMDAVGPIVYDSSMGGVPKTAILKQNGNIDSMILQRSNFKSYFRFIHNRTPIMVSEQIQYTISAAAQWDHLQKDYKPISNYLGMTMSEIRINYFSPLTFQN